LSFLVTGGAGFVGSHLVDVLVQRGDSVTVLDDLSTGRLENLEHVLGSDQVHFVEGSACDEEIVDELMASADACLHLASAVGVKLIIAQPLDSLLRNIRSNDIVISAAARHRRPLLFTSTSEIYGKANDGPMREDADRVLGSPFKTRWAYANAKAFGESLAYAYHRETGFPMVVARLFNAVGARQTGAYGMVLPRFVNQALAGDELTVYGNGTQTRSFCHVIDTVDALVRLLDCEAAQGSVYNVGSPVEIPIIELARRVIDRTRSTSTIRLIPYSDAYEDGFEELGRRVPDITAIQQLTGWRPAHTVEDAIDDVIASLSERRRVGGSAGVAD
jgi:UDP-glucose 4-epimerase